MPTFPSYDGTLLVYHILGQGPPLICLPGGPGRPSGYLGDLGGLGLHHRLILLDGRGTGESATPGDPGTYRADRLVADVEALRAHLALDAIDLLAHSAAADLAVLYAARHPERVRRLVLLTPGLAAAGIEVTDEEWIAAVERRSAEPWYGTACAALDAWDAGDDREEVRMAARPFFYNPWNAAAEEHARSFPSAPAAAKGFAEEGAYHPATTRAELSRLTAPVLVVSGDDDLSPTAVQAESLVTIFPDARTISVPGAHFPWVTYPRELSTTITSFLSAGTGMTPPWW
ncbi:alpha/beta fold hydrolase [Spongiactinospora sp. 9N601]|uniref:alpha/beta fold hydrolase n=1 Tax=Spongiactinospora sp. 9N601 TaxID=3375149 RepID=UPI0037B23475